MAKKKLHQKNIPSLLSFQSSLFLTYCLKEPRSNAVLFKRMKAWFFQNGPSFSSKARIQMLTYENGGDMKKRMQGNWFSILQRQRLAFVCM
ncbi:hypothetical protein [Domibacillus sp.]|uniref:hypothetical protein n=1 Tax=Domibacillus sp. TaxID=1969783 RepID=UPI002811C6E4|nr:hypothetical protein [Domibacillus sp.]